MRPITSGIHRALDFVTVVVFALAPTLLHLTGFPGVLSYALATVHLTLTLLTQFADWTPRPVPFHLHGWVEAAVGPILILLPLLAGWTGTPRLFYLAAGAVIALVWALTTYRPALSGRGH